MQPVAKQRSPIANPAVVLIANRVQVFIRDISGWITLRIKSNNALGILINILIVVLTFSSASSSKRWLPCSLWWANIGRCHKRFLDGFVLTALYRSIIFSIYLFHWFKFAWIAYSILKSDRFWQTVSKSLISAPIGASSLTGVRNRLWWWWNIVNISMYHNSNLLLKMIFCTVYSRDTRFTRSRGIRLSRISRFSTKIQLIRSEFFITFSTYFD